MSFALSIKKKLLLSEVARTIEYIPLETSNLCLLKQIQKMKITDSLIYASDSDQLLIFDRKGKFIGKVGRKGFGPGEYVSVWDFDISPNKRNIYIFDSSQKKVIAYTLNGRFKNEFKINSYPTNIALLNDNTIVAAWPFPIFLLNNNNRFTSFSLTGLQKESHPAQTEELAGKEQESFKNAVISSSFFNSCNDTLTYFEQGLNKILYISKSGKVSAKYYIVKQANGTDHLNILKYIGTDDYLFFPNCIYRGDIKRIIYNKRTKEAFTVISDYQDPRIKLKIGFINDIDGGYPFNPDGVTEDGKVFCNFNSYDAKFLHEKGVIKLNSPVKEDYMVNEIDVNYLFKEIKDNDNPVIMMVSLK